MADKEVTELAGFDFGFTLSTGQDIDFVQQVETEHQSEVESYTAKILTLEENAGKWQTKAQTIYNAIQTLLANLSVAPEKNYIVWNGEQRVAQIKAFAQKLEDILMK